MGVQSNFFGKRDSGKTEPSSAPATPATSAAPLTPGAAKPAGFFGASAPSATPPSATAAPFAGAPAASVPAADAAAPKQSKLTVGPNIKLKGVEITDCDVLFIEGVVEATLDSHLIQIAQQGSFNGTANIDIAEIRGTFEGDLTVRDKLTVFSTGKVQGKIRYGKLVVEEGATITGEISASGTGGASSPASTDSN
ncbi:polymer-forming cytoskeletal protein [Corticibacter populi]|uniref:Polymer-forming cytoskeletal protein n=1 Tax=Corticibacter populi TaxID=1550736 RepID=A0A3M6QIZ5_9BURK|nr:polymer-forming cytoskeletal protein [Corticibacter populi]RMX03028.1 polymer-forming cytoskeletal protein [Corticibacter populi]RZS33461.1 cytoskeletal protein CcmA (bactofilin family) [Corticibacter populi]